MGYTATALLASLGDGKAFEKARQVPAWLGLVLTKTNCSSRQGITSSVFNLLSIDPLTGLDPATRELANTRLFAERGMFLARHMPTLIRWETELLAINTAEMPQMQKLLVNTAQLSESADRFSQTAERLPGLISAERQQIVQALDEQRPGLINLAAQTEKALAAGRQKRYFSLPRTASRPAARACWIPTQRVGIQGKWKTELI